MRFPGCRRCHYCSDALHLQLLVTLVLLIGISSRSTSIAGLSKDRYLATARLLPKDSDIKSENSENSSKPKHKPKKDSAPEGIKETNPLVKPEEESGKQSFGNPSTFLQLLLAAFILLASIGTHYWKMKRSKRTSRRKGLEYAPIATNGGETEMTEVETSRSMDEEEEDDEIDAEYGEEEPNSDDLPGFAMRGQ